MSDMLQLTLNETSLPAIDSATGIDALCIFVGEDERPIRGLGGYADWRLGGALSRILKSEHFSGYFGDCLLYPVTRGLNFQRVFFFGIGSRNELTSGELWPILRNAMDVIQRAGCQSCALEIPGINRDNASSLLRIFVETCLKGFKGTDMVLYVRDVSIVSGALKEFGETLARMDICIDDKVNPLVRQRAAAALSRPM